MTSSRVHSFFLQCEDAIHRETPIVRESARDKEFAVQDWVRDRLDDAQIGYVESGRNTYPDFPLTGEPPEGFEVKSLAYPGRDTSYDANSQPPCGVHGGRTVFYIFVRYPKEGRGTYPVVPGRRLPGATRGRQRRNRLRVRSQARRSAPNLRAQPQCRQAP